MEICRTAAEIRAAVARKKVAGERVGFVPTMGALHDGHLSLVDEARQKAECIVVSIFVNPLQFNVATDLDAYPKTLERDLELCRERGVAIVFCPDETAIYGTNGDLGPSGTGREGRVTIRAGSRALGLCGGTREGHFDGVVTVVGILFHLVQPDVAVFGEKDYQQVKVISQMVDDLQFPVEVVEGKLIRDSDGLALSSRNVRLSPEDRYHALTIPKVLDKLQEAVDRGERSVGKLRALAATNLEHSGALRIDYVEIVDPEALTPLERIDSTAQALIAAFVGEVRLIDNKRLTVK